MSAGQYSVKTTISIPIQSEKNDHICFRKKPKKRLSFVFVFLRFHVYQDFDECTALGYDWIIESFSHLLTVWLMWFWKGVDQTPKNYKFYSIVFPSLIFHMCILQWKTGNCTLWQIGECGKIFNFCDTRWRSNRIHLQEGPIWGQSVAIILLVARVAEVAQVWT